MQFHMFAVLAIVTVFLLFLGANIIRGRRLLEVFVIFLPKIRVADIIRGRILLEVLRYSNDKHALRVEKLPLLSNAVREENARMKRFSSET